MKVTVNYCLSIVGK